MNLNNGYFTETNEFICIETGQVITDPFLIVVMLSDPKRAKPYLDWYKNRNPEIMNDPDDTVLIYHLDNPDMIINTHLTQVYGHPTKAFEAFYHWGITIDTVFAATAYRLA